MNINRSEMSSEPPPQFSQTFVCWGELLWDIFATGPELGGSAANVAINLHRLGARPLLVSRVGRDALGDAAILRLSSYGLDTSFIQRDWTAPTGTVDVTFNGDEPIYTIASEAAWDRIEIESHLSSHFSDIGGIVYGTLAQRAPIVQDALKNLLRSRSPQCWAICDLNLRPPHVSPTLVQEALAFADVVKMNEQELGQVAEILATSDPVLRIFDDFPVRVLAVTRKERGCTLFTREGRFDHPGFPLLDNQGDSVGAGDAFTAMLAFELVRGTSIDVVGKRANDHARRVASARGAFGFSTAESEKRDEPG